MDSEAERKRCEETWTRILAKDAQTCPISRKKNGDYHAPFRERAWEAWQEAIAALRGQGEPVATRFRKPGLIDKWLGDMNEPAMSAEDVDKLCSTGMEVQHLYAAAPPVRVPDALLTFVREIALGAYRPDELKAKASEVLRLNAAPSGWQPISSPPKEDTECLVFWDGDFPMDVAIYSGNGAWQRAFYDMGEYDVLPTHWMPLPAPPSEGEAGGSAASAGYGGVKGGDDALPEGR